MKDDEEVYSMTLPMDGEPAPHRSRFVAAVIAWVALFAIAGWMIWQSWWILAILVLAVGALAITVVFRDRDRATPPEPDPDHHLPDGGRADFHGTHSV